MLSVLALVASLFFREKQEQHKSSICHIFQHSWLNMWQILLLYWTRKRLQRCGALLDCSSC